MSLRARAFRPTGCRLRVVATLIVAGFLAAPARAHRLDELLQATLVAVEPEWVRVEIRLTPGVEVVRPWVDAIDGDRDGVISPAEGRLHALGVWADVELWWDGKRLKLESLDHEVSPMEDLLGGVGFVRIRARAGLGRVSDGDHRVVLVNRHRVPTSVFLVNALAPTHRRITLRSQSRDETQTTFRLAYTLRPFEPTPE